MDWGVYKIEGIYYNKYGICTFPEETILQVTPEKRLVNSYATILLIKYRKYYGIYIHETFVAKHVKLFLFLVKSSDYKLLFLAKNFSK